MAHRQHIDLRWSQPVDDPVVAFDHLTNMNVCVLANLAPAARLTRDLLPACEYGPHPALGVDGLILGNVVNNLLQAKLGAWRPNNLHSATPYHRRSVSVSTPRPRSLSANPASTSSITSKR